MIQAAVHEHYSMGHATLDRQVGHIPDLLGAVVEPAEGKVYRQQGEYGKVVADGEQYKRQEDEHIQALLAAQEADNKAFGGEAGEHFEDQLEGVDLILEFDEPGLLQGSCKILCSCGPENSVLPYVSVHLQSFLGIGCFWSSQNHCIAA